MCLGNQANPGFGSHKPSESEGSGFFNMLFGSFGSKVPVPVGISTFSLNPEIYVGSPEKDARVDELHKRMLELIIESGNSVDGVDSLEEIKSVMGELEELNVPDEWTIKCLEDFLKVPFFKR